MRVTCPSCQTAYNIDERRIPPGGAKLKCSTCQTLIPLRRPEVEAPPVAAARPAPSVGGVRLAQGAVPLPRPGLGGAPRPPLPRPTPHAPGARGRAARRRPPTHGRDSLAAGPHPPPARPPGGGRLPPPPPPPQ